MASAMAAQRSSTLRAAAFLSRALSLAKACSMGLKSGEYDAKSRLASAKHNHEKPQGVYDHARAIAKADAALGYAKAADIFHFKLMQK